MGTLGVSSKVLICFIRLFELSLTFNQTSKLGQLTLSSFHSKKVRNFSAVSKVCFAIKVYEEHHGFTFSKSTKNQDGSP
mgnify:CR=1 FL=1